MSPVICHLSLALTTMAFTTYGNNYLGLSYLGFSYLSSDTWASLSWVSSIFTSVPMTSYLCYLSSVKNDVIPNHVHLYLKKSVPHSTGFEPMQYLITNLNTGALDLSATETS